MIQRSWAFFRQPDGQMSLAGQRLVKYYGHSREWWQQAIWFYNKMHSMDLDVPDDLFEVAERVGAWAHVPDDLTVYSQRVLEFWEKNHRLAEVVLPES